MFPIQSTTEDSSKLFVDDVFAVHLYTGNGSTQTINNGIDLAGKGGLVWCKSRSGSENNGLFDTLRGGNSILASNSTNTAQVPSAPVTFLSNGYSHAGSGTGNSTSTTYVSWTFRKAPKFFDVVTWTGNGVESRQISHSLGIEPGMIIVKCTSFAGTEWKVFHRSLSSTWGMILNNTGAQSIGVWPATQPTSSSFYVTSGGDFNANGQTYVAYLFAHDPSADGIIQCGIGTSLNLGWEPQFVLFKNPTGTSNWEILDTARGWANADNAANGLRPNTAEAEQQWNFGSPTATGTNALSGATQMIYLAIRRPNKPPTSGTQV